MVVTDLQLHQKLPLRPGGLRHSTLSSESDKLGPPSCYRARAAGGWLVAGTINYNCSERERERAISQTINKTF